MRNLNFQLKNLCERNRDGSHATQFERFQTLQAMADLLHEMGYRQMEARSLKPKHVEALIDRYQAEGLSIGTIKNRLAVLRWWAEKVNKQNVIARDNAHYGIGSREFVTNVSKAVDVDKQQLAKIADLHVRMSLELQKAFGLRREEAIKFNPHYADRENHIHLKSTWCKGGRERDVPIRTEAQREVLDRAHKLAGRGSLIPPNLKYVQQMRIYERETHKAGLSRLHGLRHRYAQGRYFELTGREAPACGGKTRDELSEEERAQDTVARHAITQELGHGRPSVTGVYLGT